MDSLAAMFGHQTFPLFTMLMLFLGFGVGVMNVMRISKTRRDTPSRQLKRIARSVAAEGKIDPMHQFTVEPIVPLQHRWL